MTQFDEVMVRSQLDFVPDKQKIENFKLQLSAISQVTNDDELLVAEGLVKSAKQFYKEVETLRKGFTVRLDNIKKEAMRFEKELAEAYEPKEKLISNFLREKELKRQAELLRIQQEQAKKAAELAAQQRKIAEQKEAVLKFELSAKKAVSECTTMEDLADVESKIAAYVITEEMYGVNVAECEEKRKEVFQLITTQRLNIANKKVVVPIDTKAVEVAIEQQQLNATMEAAEALQALDLETQARTQTISETTGIRKVWTFEVDDITKVPAELLVVDTTKVNALIKGGTRTISGLRIFQDIARSGR